MTIHEFDVHPEFPVEIAHQAQVMQSDPLRGAMFTRRWGNARPTRTYTLHWRTALRSVIDRIKFLWNETRGAGEMTWRPTEDVRVSSPSIPDAIRVVFYSMPTLPVRSGPVTGEVTVTLAEVVPGG